MKSGRRVPAEVRGLLSAGSGPRNQRGRVAMDVADEDISFWALCLEGESDPKKVFEEMKNRGLKAMQVYYEFLQESGPNLRIVNLEALDGRTDLNDDFWQVDSLIERVIGNLINNLVPESNCEDMNWFAVVDFTVEGSVVADLRYTPLVRVINDMLLL
jgi:hypothetical protein